jgi:hypothetical protein
MVSWRWWGGAAWAIGSKARAPAAAAQHRRSWTAAAALAREIPTGLRRRTASASLKLPVEGRSMNEPRNDAGSDGSDRSGAGLIQRDFFISFNSADRAYADAIDAALRAEGFTTYHWPNEVDVGDIVPRWMDEALMNSAQTLALHSPDYMKKQAVYSRVEDYASWWQDAGRDTRKLIPVVLRETTLTPTIAIISRIEVTGMTPDEAAKHIVERLKKPDEAKARDLWRGGLPLPKIFNALYRPNPNFTGRFEAMESLQQSLRAGNAAVTAVAGMGGVGKTTLAAEYCHRFCGRYGGVWWIRAEQEPVMLGDLQALGQWLGVASGANTEADARTTLDHLASVTQLWLLVYDNAPNPDAVRKWLPAGAVRCLITSRFVAFDDIARSRGSTSGRTT